MVFIKYKGSRNFRQIIICATLSGHAVRIEEIHSEDPTPGLREYEISFLRLIEKITNGCTIEINETGTSVYYKPGIIVCGTATHDCTDSGRAIGYYLEGILPLAPFGKVPLNITFEGITNDNIDPSVDLIKSVMLPNIVRFGGVEPEGVELRILRRGSFPRGGGKVVFVCPVAKTMKPIQLLDEGLIRRIRGVAYCAKISPQTANRMIESARSVLNGYARDVFLFSDFRKGEDGGKAPGFSIALVAETTTGCLLSAEMAGNPGDVPEDVGIRAANLLLEEIGKRGCVDTMSQWICLLMMILSPEDVSKIRLGKLSQFTIDCLRLYKEMFGIQFKVLPDPESKTVIMSCLGMGYTNIAKRIY